MVKKKTDSCDPVYLSQYFDALSSNKEMGETERREIISSMIQGCYNYKAGNPNEASIKPIKKKKKPSGYNLFIGDCMKEGAKPMKECAGDWKGLNEYNKNDWKAKAAESRLY